MAGTRKELLPSGYVQGWFLDATGAQRFFKGTKSHAETLRIAQRIEDDHRQVKLGYHPPPKSFDKARARTFEDVTLEYLAHGRACGGIGGRPWSAEHAVKRDAGLTWWRVKLGLATLADLDGILPRVEKALRELQDAGKANLTIQHRATCLTAFCGWCVQHGLLGEDPLKMLVAYPKQAKHTRRAMTAEEVQKLLEACNPARRLTYETALSSGLRANELRLLTPADLDAARGGLKLRPDWTKNRRHGFQPLPSSVMARLVEASKGKRPDEPILIVGEHTARDLDKDLERAGLLKHGPGGKVDFHALRVAYTTFVIESGANIKEAQALARHSTPDLTLNTYARARQDRLAEIAEAVGRAALPAVEALPALRTGTDDAPITPETEQKYVTGMLRGSAQSHKIRPINTLTNGRAESHALPPVKNKDLQERNTVEQNRDTVAQGRTYPNGAQEVKPKNSEATAQNLNVRGQSQGKAAQEKYVEGMFSSDADFARLASTWPGLPPHIKAAIMALAGTVKP
jgi:integrase